MADNIKHSGVVETVEGSHISVRILQTSACSSCSVKGHCTSADTKEKLIDVENFSGYPYKEGDRVMVIGTQHMGTLAVLYAFIIPFLILIISLFILKEYVSSDLTSSLLSLSLLIPYYIILYTQREKMAKKFTFTLRPLE